MSSATVLVANRGEIALRIIRTARETGLKFVRYNASRGKTNFLAEGLAGYESAVKLGLQSVLLDRAVPGTVEVAVTEERVGSAFSSLTGEAFDVGPIPSGPGGLARVHAHVEIGEPRIRREVGELITFTVEIMLTIGLVVDLRVDRVRYDVDGLITLPIG